MREFHLCMDIRNTILNSNDKELGQILIEKGGRNLSARQTKEFLLDQLAMGRKFIPCVPCDTFDYQTGCPGHEMPSRQPEADIHWITIAASKTCVAT